MYNINKKNLGTLGEIMAEDYLERNSYQILRRNYRCIYGEIDIIAGKNGTLAFVEVKLRSSSLYGSPMDSVGNVKRKKIRRTAAHYLNSARNRFYDELSFDIICLEMKAGLPVDTMSKINKTAAADLRSMFQKGNPAGINPFIRDLSGFIKIYHIENAF